MNPDQVPIAFIERMRASLGDDFEAFKQSLSEAPNISIAVNPKKSLGCPEGVGAVAWNADGRYLSERPSYVSDPRYHAGAYYPQEASSMVINAVVERLPLGKAPLCLDLCAAPGGKSIGILGQIPKGGMLISNEVIRARTKILIENLRKWGPVNWLPASAHPSQWAKQQDLFDLILVDAPCSGEGMFRKEAKAHSEWSLANVEFCAQRQGSILSDIVPAVKEGGFLIYSTCTYAPQENEEMVSHLISLGMLPYVIELPEEWGFAPVGDHRNAYQGFIHKVRGEGLFVSVFQKSGNHDTGISQEESEEVDIVDPIAMRIPEGYALDEKEGAYYLTSTRFAHEIDQLKSARLLLDTSLYVGRYKGKDFLPSHVLAMSGLLDHASTIPLDYDRSISYLRRETFELEAIEDGWHLASFEGTILGWIKVAAGRMKNHYPKEWMIRKRW